MTTRRDDGLSSHARSVLDAARDADDPTPDDRARVRRALMAAMATGAASAAASAAAPAAAASAAGAVAKSAGAGLSVAPSATAVSASMGGAAMSAPAAAGGTAAASAVAGSAVAGSAVAGSAVAGSAVAGSAAVGSTTLAAGLAAKLIATVAVVGTVGGGAAYVVIQNTRTERVEVASAEHAPAEADGQSRESSRAQQTRGALARPGVDGTPAFDTTSNAPSVTASAPRPRQAIPSGARGSAESGDPSSSESTEAPLARATAASPLRDERATPKDGNRHVREAAPLGSVAADEVPPDGVSRDEALRDEAVHDQAIHEQAVHDQAVHEQAVHDQAAHDQAAHDQAAHDPTAADATSTHARTGLAQELELIRGAHAARRRRDPRTALSLLREHASRFPSGILEAERSATRVLALCDLGSIAEASLEANRFLSRFGGSPLAERVRRSCVTR